MLEESLYLQLENFDRFITGQRIIQEVRRHKQDKVPFSAVMDGRNIVETYTKPRLRDFSNSPPATSKILPFMPLSPHERLLHFAPHLKGFLQTLFLVTRRRHGSRFQRASFPNQPAIPNRRLPRSRKKFFKCRAQRFAELHLPVADEDVSRKFETYAQFPHLVQGELPLLGQKHRDGTFRSEFGNQITLR